MDSRPDISCLCPRSTAWWRWCPRVLVALAALVCTIACQEAKPSKAALEARVAEFWGCKVKGDNVRLYDFYEPTYRENTNLQDFLMRRSGAAVFDGFEIDSVEISGTEATAFVTYRWHMSPEITRGIQASVKTVPRYPGQWVWVEGQWYHKGPETGESGFDQLGGREDVPGASATRQEADE